MPYCTQDDLVKRFGTNELKNFAGDDNGDIDPAAISKAIADANDEINLYVGKVTTLPLDEPFPGVLQRLASDIARYRIQDKRPMEEAEDRYEQAVKTLKDIAAGRADLGLDKSVQQSISVSVDRTLDDRKFTMNSLRDF